MHVAVGISNSKSFQI